MIKDLFIAIALGSILGIAATSGYFSIKNSKSHKATNISPTPIISVNPSISPVEEKIETTSSNISIISPANESVVTTSKTIVEGTTKPNAIVVVKSTLKQQNVSADSAGHFKTEVDLESGINQILISAFDADDNQYDMQLLVTYSTAKF